MSGILTVVPEPSSLALAGMGTSFGPLWLWRKRRASNRTNPSEES